MSDDPQDVAEALDEDTIVTADDVSGDTFGDGLADYPPERAHGVNTVGVTPVEEDTGESFAERTWREEPERFDAAADPDDVLDDRDYVGQLIDGDAASVDVEQQPSAEAVGGEVLTAEEQAMHVEEA
jgi:hypothetical protein